MLLGLQHLAFTCIRPKPRPFHRSIHPLQARVGGRDAFLPWFLLSRTVFGARDKTGLEESLRFLQFEPTLIVYSIFHHTLVFLSTGFDHS